MQTKKPESLNFSPCGWEAYKDLLIHRGLLRKGIVFVKPMVMSDEITQSITDSRFCFKERELVFVSKDNMDCLSKSCKRWLKKSEDLLSQIDSEAKVNIMIINLRRREEIFLPLILNENKELMGLYVHLWISNSTQFKFSSFDNFVTCGCMFGSNLQAIDNDNNQFTLIRHTKLSNQQIIKHILFEAMNANPYEDTLFFELKKIALIINKFTTKNHPKKLLYHLPYYDYILFGIMLYIQAKLSFLELNKLIELVCFKTRYYMNRITSICSIYDIKVSIQSPFDNLFGFPEDWNKMTEHIFTILNLTINDSYFLSMSADEKIECELNLMQFCLEKLTKNKFNTLQQIVWNDFILANSLELKDFESFFKLANAVIIALAGNGSKDYKTCSLLPLSEKQIQVQYASIINNKTSYSAVFNMTMLDPIISLSHRNDGSLFYLDSYQDTLSDLIVNKKLLESAYRNLSIFAQKNRNTGTENENILWKSDEIKNI